MFARVATHVGGDVERLRQMNEERMEEGTMGLPDGMSRALVLQGDGKRLFVTFFETREAIAAAEARFEEMGDEIPEDVRGKRTDVHVYEVVYDSAV